MPSRLNIEVASIFIKFLFILSEVMTAWRKNLAVKESTTQCSSDLNVNDSLAGKLKWRPRDVNVRVRQTSLQFTIAVNMSDLFRMDSLRILYSI